MSASVAAMVLVNETWHCPIFESRNLDRLELFELASAAAICEMVGPGYLIRATIQMLSLHVTCMCHAH
jgi:hypothetical protein